jgi:hypothetical protein
MEMHPLNILKMIFIILFNNKDKINENGITRRKQNERKEEVEAKFSLNQMSNDKIKKSIL